MLYISSSCVNASDIIEAIEQISSITKNIELSGGTSSAYNCIDRLIGFKNNGFEFLVHNYFPIPQESFLLNFADTSNKIRAFIEDSMCYVNLLDIDYYSIYAGFRYNFLIKNELLEKGNFNFLRQIFFQI